MTSTSIQPTLQRWAELEPERCILIDPLQWEYSIIASSEQGLVGEIRVNGIAPSCRELMLLESVLRDVMISRRIRPSVGLLDIDLPIWVSRANKFMGTDSTAAIALLKAYLECLSNPSTADVIDFPGQEAIA